MATFGYTSVGVSGAGISDNDITGTKYVLSESASVSKITVSAKIAVNNVNNMTDALCAIYNDSNTLIARTGISTVIGTTSAWYDFFFNPLVMLSAGTYWLVIYGAVDSDQLAVDFDTDATVVGCRQLDVGYPVLPTTLTPGTDNDRKNSIYATYTSPPATAWLKA